MSEPTDNPPTKPKLFERDPERPNKPAEQPKEPKDPADKPELFPREPADPPAEEPAPEPTPRDPADLPKIATERLMDTDEDGDGRPDRWGQDDPIAGDDETFGDVVAGGPPAAQTASAAAPSTGAEGGLERPDDDGVGNFETQRLGNHGVQRLDDGQESRDVFVHISAVSEDYQALPDFDASTGSAAGVTLPGLGKVRGDEADGAPVDLADDVAPAGLASSAAGTANALRNNEHIDGSLVEPIDSGIRKDSGEAVMSGGTTMADDPVGVVMSGGTTMAEDPVGVVMSGGTTMAHDPIDDGQPGQLDGITDDPEGDAMIFVKIPGDG